MINHEIKILAFVGLSGAGVSTAVDYLAEKGFPKADFNKFIFDSMDQAGIEYGEKNEEDFREKILSENGSDFIATKIIEQIHNLINAGQHQIVIDGPNSWDEYVSLKHEFPGEMRTIAIVAGKHLRHHRLQNRTIHPLSDNETDKRDWDEIEKLQKAGPIAVADHFVVNDGNVDEFHAQIDKLIEE